VATSLWSPATPEVHVAIPQLSPAVFQLSSAVFQLSPAVHQLSSAVLHFSPATIQLSPAAFHFLPAVPPLSPAVFQLSPAMFHFYRLTAILTGDLSLLTGCDSFLSGNVPIVICQTTTPYYTTSCVTGRVEKSHNRTSGCLEHSRRRIVTDSLYAETNPRQVKTVQGKALFHS